MGAARMWKLGRPNTPTGNRTPVFWLRTRCPRPLDDGGRLALPPPPTLSNNRVQGASAPHEWRAPSPASETHSPRIDPPRLPRCGSHRDRRGPLPAQQQGPGRQRATRVARPESRERDPLPADRSAAPAAMRFSPRPARTSPGATTWSRAPARHTSSAPRVPRARPTPRGSIRRARRDAVLIAAGEDLSPPHPTRNRPGGNRTPNRRFWRPVLYQLSYGPTPVAGDRIELSTPRFSVVCSTN